MNPEPTTDPDPAAVKITLPAKRRYIPHLAQGCVLVLILLVLAAILWPVSSGCGVRSPETKAMAQAKQIGLALKIFAGDHDGCYPTTGVPSQMRSAPANSNIAFAALFPNYTASEKIFGNKFSAYQTRAPDDVIDNPSSFPPVKTLEHGENVYAYISGLTESSPPDAPIVMDGTDGTRLYYNQDRKTRGGVWEGKRAVVVYLDNHAALENLAGRENTRYIESNRPGRPKNLLDVSWMGPDIHLLDPAVAP